MLEKIAFGMYKLSGAGSGDQETVQPDGPLPEVLHSPSDEALPCSIPGVTHVGQRCMVTLRLILCRPVGMSLGASDVTELNFNDSREDGSSRITVLETKGDQLDNLDTSARFRISSRRTSVGQHSTGRHAGVAQEH